MTLFSNTAQDRLGPNIYILPTQSHLPMVKATAVVLGFCLVRLLYIRYVYNVYLHPLAKFPGPREAALSDKWLWDVQSTGRAEQTFEALHKELGNVARSLGEVAFADNPRCTRDQNRSKRVAHR